MLSPNRRSRLGMLNPGSYINLRKGGRFRTHPKYETTKHCWVRPAVRIREADEMNYFFAGKSAGRTEPAAAEGAHSTEITSVLGPNTTIAGQIVSGGTLHVYGRLEGDIYGEKVELRSGALVRGDIIAQDALIEGNFDGTVRANNVKLGAGAAVVGEIYHRSLSMEPDAVFEGIALRLTETIAAPPLRIRVGVKTSGLDGLLGSGFVKGDQTGF